MNPLSPGVYLRRNAKKTAPLVAVIVLAVMLIMGIVSMMNSIPLSIRTIYDYSRRYTGFTPRGDATLTPKIAERIKAGAPVKIGRIITARGSDTVVKSIVGKWPFVVLAMNQEDTRYYLDQMKVTKIDGRIPEKGKPEAIISEPVARNLGLKLGQSLLGPENTEGYSPFEVKIVGIAQTPQWVMLAPIDYYREHHFPPIDVLLVFAYDANDQAAFDRWALEEFKGDRTRVFAYAQLDKDTNEMFNILYKILNVVIGTLVLVITVMMGMLMNIYQSQRVQEFGLLQALGYTRSQLLSRVLVEAVFVVIGGWLAGLACAYGLLNVVKRVLMDPQAFSLATFDQTALTYTIPVPIAIFGAALLTVWIRFRKFDPVGVVERRLV